MSRTDHKIGDRFGRLSVICIEPKRIDTETKCMIAWQCRCDCGVEGWYGAKLLHAGKTRSCGCLRREVAKGVSPKYKTAISATPGRLRAYRSWEKMKTRCLNPKSDHYRYYGARGIMICARWIENFDNFFEDMGERPEGTTIGRKDNNGNYELDNCRWETTEQQVNNKSNTLKVRGKPLVIFCKEKGLDAGRIRSRLTLGWTLKDSIAKPIRQKKITIFGELP